MTEEPDQKTETKPKKKFRPIRFMLCLIIFCIVVIIIKFLLIQTAKPNIAVDYAAKINNLSRPENYDPDDNAALLYKKAADSHTLLGSDLGDIYGRLFFYEIGLELWPGDYSDDELDRVREGLGLNDQSLKSILIAASKPYAWKETVPTQDWQSTYFFNEHISLVEMLIWQAKLYLLDNNTDAAIECLRACIKIAVQLETIPPTGEASSFADIRSETAIAFASILDRCPIDTEHLKSFQQFLSENPPDPNVEMTLKIEKYRMLDIIQRIYTDDGEGDGVIIPPKVKEVFGYSPDYDGFAIIDWFDIGEVFGEIGMFFKSMANDKIITYQIYKMCQPRKVTVEKLEKLYKVIARTMPQTPAYLNSKGTSHGQELESVFEFDDSLILRVLSSHLLPFSYYGSLCQHNALITNIALHRYNIDKGQFPKSLNELVHTGYLTELPMDPFSDKSLAYKLTDDSYILYGVFKNCKDDGGNQYDYTYWPPNRPKKGVPNFRAVQIESEMPTDPNQIT